MSLDYLPVAFYYVLEQTYSRKLACTMMVLNKQVKLYCHG